MSSIDGIVSTIRTAIYGKDMRAAIADGFELLNSDTIKLFDSTLI